MLVCAYCVARFEQKRSAHTSNVCIYSVTTKKKVLYTVLRQKKTMYAYTVLVFRKNLSMQVFAFIVRR
jgi:hypothetical protein